MARSVTSVSIAKAISWIENARSSIDAPCLRNARAAVSRPLNATSIPFTRYGRGTSVVPSRASFSRIGPPRERQAALPRELVEQVADADVERLSEDAIPTAGERDHLRVPSAHVQEDGILRRGDAAADLQVGDAVVHPEDRHVEGEGEGARRG